MKIEFATKITPESLQEHAVNIGWDDCSSLQDGVFSYETASGSASLTVSQDGVGEYNGQRSLLFSHSIFSRLTKAWIDDDLEVTDLKSQDDDIPAFVYFGMCYMRDLRDEALHKALAPLAPKGFQDDYFTAWVKRAFTARAEITDISIGDGTTEKCADAITAGLKGAYRSWCSR